MVEIKLAVELSRIAEVLLEVDSVHSLTVPENVGTNLFVLQVHGPHTESQIARINHKLHAINRVKVGSESIRFYYDIDPDPPTAYQKVELFVPDRLAGDEKMGPTATTLQQGIENVRSHYC